MWGIVQGKLTERLWQRVTLWFVPCMYASSKMLKNPAKFIAMFRVSPGKPSTSGWSSYGRIAVFLKDRAWSDITVA
jgi:hypothetical protein